MPGRSDTARNVYRTYFLSALEDIEVHAPVERGFLSADGIAAQADVFAEAVGDFLLRILLLLSPC